MALSGRGAASVWRTGQRGVDRNLRAKARGGRRVPKSIYAGNIVSRPLQTQVLNLDTGVVGHRQAEIVLERKLEIAVFHEIPQPRRRLQYDLGIDLLERLPKII